MRTYQLKTKLLEEAEAMASYASSQGLPLPGDLMDALSIYLDERDGLIDNKKEEDLSIGLLSTVHSHLSAIITPTTPSTIMLIEKEKAAKRLFLFLSPIPLVRRLMLALMFFATTLVVISLTNDFTTDFWGVLFDNMDVKPWIIVTCAAGLGATFSGLYRVNQYVVAGNYNSKYASTYWSEFILGIISGVLLAEVILPNQAAISETTTIASISKVLLAIAGGLASDVVYKILMRIVSAFEVLIKDDPKSIKIKTQQKAELEYQKKMVETKAKLLYSLSEIKTQALVGNTNNVNKGVDQVIEDLLPTKKSYSYQNKIDEAKGRPTSNDGSLVMNDDQSDFKDSPGNNKYPKPAPPVKDREII